MQAVRMARTLSCGERGLVRRRMQIVLRELRQGVCPARRIEQIGRHSRVEHDPRRLHAESQQRTQQRLAVVHGLRHVRRKQGSSSGTKSVPSVSRRST